MLSVKQVQLNLRHIGYYYKGAIDGIEGRLTKAAYRSFQQDSKLVVDGIYGKKTEQALIQMCKDMQTALNKSGANLIVDGIVGIKTITAIKKYQSSHGLLSDGIIGEKTMDKLNAEIAQSTYPTVIWNNVKYFKKYEFECGCNKRYCDGYPAEMNKTLIDLLDRTREHFGQPILITSGLRCVKQNKIVGGIPNSKHLYGKAADCSLNSDSRNDTKLYAWFKKQPEVSYTYTGFNAVHVDVK